MIEFLKKITDIIYSFFEYDFLISYLIKSSIILLSVLIIQQLLKNYSSGLRYRLWNVTLVVLLLIPLTPYPDTTVAISLYEDYTPISETEYENIPSGIASENTGFRGENQKTAPLSLAFHEASALVWLAGGIVLIFFLIREIIWLWFLIHGGLKVSEKTNHLLRDCKRLTRFNRKVYVFSNARITTPMTFGFLFPVIILPVEEKSWSVEKINIVLLHELTHIKRNDYITNLIASLGVVVCWYNPFAWIALRFQKFECEKSCDEKVLANNISPNLYATELLNIAKMRRTGKFRTNSVVSILGATGIKSRIQHIIRHQHKRKTLPQSLTILLILFLSFEAVALSSIRFSSEEKTVPIPFHRTDPTNIDADELLTDLKDKDQKVRLRAAELLIGMRDRNIIAPVLNQLDVETSPEVKVRLIAAYMKFQDSKEFYRVARHISSGDLEVKVQVLEYMKVISCFPSYLVVEACQNSPDQQVALAARQFLSGFDDRKLKKSIKNFAVNFKHNNDVSHVIGRKMSRIKGFQVIDVVTEILKSNDRAKKRALGEKLLLIAENEEFDLLKEVVYNSE